MSSLLRVYSRNFERRPYLTLCIANGVLMSIGDISAQIMGLSNGMQMAFDIERLSRFAIFGASMGPLGGAWNKFLEVNFPLRIQQNQNSVPMQKVKVDDMIPGLEKELPKNARLERGGIAPGAGGGIPGGAAGTAGAVMPTIEAPVSVAQLAKRVAADQLGMAPISLFIFLFSMSLLEGLDGEEVRERFRNQYFAILFVNWQVWPLFQLFNFRFTPLKYRIPVGSIAGILWTCFLSAKTQQAPASSAR
ncbi:hypothetical protein JCM8202_001841 [Rhodotorula sphaerocarpa]